MATRARIEPDAFTAAAEVSVRVVITPERGLGVGSLVECQLPNSFTADKVSPSKVKPWQLDDPAGRHHVHVSGGERSGALWTVEIKPREYVGGYGAPTRHGRCVAARLAAGRVAPGDSVVVEFRDTTAPWIANQNPGGSDHEGLVYVAVDGIRVEPSPAFRVVGGLAAYNRVIVPSGAAPGQAFRVLLVALDEFSNVSTTSFRGVEVSEGERTLASGLCFTGRHELELRIQEPGVHRLLALGVLSNPIVIGSEARGPRWGDLHIHNYPSVDAMGNVPYEYAHGVSGLDFGACTEHGAGGLPAHWAQTRAWAREWNRPGEFVSVLGFETNMRPSFHGHVNVYFRDDVEEPIPCMARTGDSLVSVAELEEHLRGRRALTQVHHTGWGFDMRLQYHESTRLIEVYSMHGTSEHYDPASSIFMDKNRRRAGDAHVGPYYVRDAWALGQRFAAHGSSDNHFGQGGVRYDSITGAYAGELTRDGILDALERGECYATTGERIILDLRVNGARMGSEIRAAAGSRLEVELRVHGTDGLAEVELFGCPFIEASRRARFGEPRFDEGDPEVGRARGAWAALWERRAIGGPDMVERFTLDFAGPRLVLYVRARQVRPIVVPCALEGVTDRQARDVYAWSSPVWVLAGSPA